MNTFSHVVTMNESEKVNRLVKCVCRSSSSAIERRLHTDEYPRQTYSILSFLNRTWRNHLDDECDRRTLNNVWFVHLIANKQMHLTTTIYSSPWRRRLVNKYVIIHLLAPRRMQTLWIGRNVTMSFSFDRSAFHSIVTFNARFAAMSERTTTTIIVIIK